MHPFLFFLPHQGARISHWTSGISQELSHSRMTVWECSPWAPRGERGWSQFMRHFWVHSQDQSLQACYLTHGWVEIPSWSWIYVLVTEPKPKVSVTEPSEAESCFQVYYWDHNWQFSCLFKISLFVHGLNISLPIWSPQLPQRHLCPWMDAKLFGWKI